MEEAVFNRKSFDDIGIRIGYIEYDKYDEAPSCETVPDRKEIRSITLRNKMTKKLERIEYTLSGAWPSISHPGYDALWGDYVTEGQRHGALYFRYNLNGDCIDIVVCFSARDMPFEDFNKLCEGIKYPAEVTARFY